MPKTPAFIIDLKSHPRSMKHGKHRRTSPPVHGSPADGTSAGTGRADAADAFSYAVAAGSIWRTNIPNLPFDLSPGAANTIDPGVVADHLIDMQRMMADAMNQLMYGMFRDEAQPKPIPHTGIHLGEIIGRRLWYVCGNGLLHSLAHDYIWEPGGIEAGNVDEVVDDWRPNPIYGGVYAFKLNEVEIEKEWNYSTYRLLETDCSHRYRHLIGLAMGTIKMWGEVVEHNRGYRAQFAKVLTIDRTVYPREFPSRDPYELYIGPRPTIDSRGWTG